MNVLQRIRPFFQVLLWLVVLTVAVNAVLQGLSSASILSWPPRVLAGGGYLDDNRQRVAGAVEEYSLGRISSDEHLGAFVGISNLREDVDLKTVADVTGGSWRFIGLGGAGFALPDITPHANVLINSDLRPDLVAVGLSLHQLVDTRPKPGAFNAGLAEYLRRGDWRNSAVAIRNWFWFYARRQDVTMAAEASVLDARERLFRSWNVHLREQQVGRHSPWREMIKSDWPEHFSANTLREQAQFFEEMGVFDAGTYEKSPKATAALVRVIEGFRSRGARVVVLLLPQHSQLRERIPRQAYDIFTTALKQKFSAEPLPLLDLRTIIDDDGFVDLPHLNRKGSTKFSKLMAEQLLPYLPKTSPLMKASSEGNGAVRAEGRAVAATRGNR